MGNTPDAPDAPQDDSAFIADSILGEFRQALADAQLQLATVNAMSKVKDTIIADLRKLLETATAPDGHTPAGE